MLDRDPDADGWTKTTDCDETDPAVHPTANELLGNGTDDDCDASTPDAPPGGLTGSMLSWGSNHNGTIGNGSFTPTLVASPVAIPGLDNVVQVEGGDRSGYAVLANGEVRAWGFNGVGDARQRHARLAVEHAGVAAVGRRRRGPPLRRHPARIRSARPRRRPPERRNRRRVGREPGGGGRRRFDRQLPPVSGADADRPGRPAADRRARGRGRLRGELRRDERRDRPRMGTDPLRRRQLDPASSAPRSRCRSSAATSARSRPATSGR